MRNKNSTFFANKSLSVRHQETVFDGFFKMRRYRFVHQLYQGGWSNEVEREVFERGDAVVVLPYDPVRDEVVLIEQLRFPALDKVSSPWLVELVAGMIDTDEQPEDVAHRELHEETGLLAQRLQFICKFLPSPGGCSELLHLYFASVDATSIQQHAGLAEENEDIRVFALPRQQVLQQLQQGEITNGATIIGLQWLALNYDKLKL
ncbi:NUDIX domain-containing protein [Paraferrimonas haliotis]|uniref:ADP-ribose pyrophosphatase n=1 Tax=Paraferrimonas haliotis TaxID=2013866 RepID=A0AA37WVF5_9GAMM|nr:NUDIX domain-containing protein [Paraferrimonas haliotis]GLS82473.1 ADP-ribose pyrophosphatase [Paraferrimonas haliotis]